MAPPSRDYILAHVRPVRCGTPRGANINIARSTFTAERCVFIFMPRLFACLVMLVTLSSVISEDPLAANRALAAKVRALMANDANMALQEESDEAGSASSSASADALRERVDAMLQSPTYDSVLEQFEDATHPLLVGHDSPMLPPLPLHAADGEMRQHHPAGGAQQEDEREEAQEEESPEMLLARAFSAERRRRRRAESALVKALERAEKAERKYRTLLRSAPRSLSKGKAAPRTRSRKL